MLASIDPLSSSNNESNISTQPKLPAVSFQPQPSPTDITILARWNPSFIMPPPLKRTKSTRQYHTRRFSSAAWHSTEDDQPIPIPPLAHPPFRRNSSVGSEPESYLETPRSSYTIDHSRRGSPAISIIGQPISRLDEGRVSYFSQDAGHFNNPFQPKLVTRTSSNPVQETIEDRRTSVAVDPLSQSAVLAEKTQRGLQFLTISALRRGKFVVATGSPIDSSPEMEDEDEFSNFREIKDDGSDNKLLKISINRHWSDETVSTKSSFSRPQVSRQTSTSSGESIESIEERLEEKRAAVENGGKVAVVRPTEPADEAILPEISSSDDEKTEDGIPSKEICIPFYNQPFYDGNVDRDLEAARPEYLTGWRAVIQRTFYLVRKEPDLVLPSAPNDVEKYSYLVTHRFTLCCLGVFGFLASSAGIWLFTVCSDIFAWYGIFAAYIQCYLSLFYLSGCLSENFDFKNHTRVLETTPLTDETAPTVDIFLPCCKEPIEILENTYKHIIKMKYPTGKLLVHVLDDGAQEEVKALAKLYGLNYICRDDRPRLKKAGNLRWAFARTCGDFFVIYDADFCPRDDFLTELIPRMMEDQKIAIIQTPQYFRTLKEQTWVEQGAGAVQELFYRFIQPNRDKWGGAICVGSNAVYRREALKETGGTAEVGASEDVHTGFFAMTRGWTVRYIPLCLACGICPDTPRAFFSQQVRWCQGSTSLLLNFHFWKSEITWKQKACFLSGMLYYSASALAIFTNPTPAILLMWFRIEFLNYYNLFFAIPNILYGLLVFRFWSRQTHSLAVQQIGIIQQYAYLSALVDRVMGTSFTWVASGDGGAHKNNRFRNYRASCRIWTLVVQALFIAVVTYRMILGVPYYNFVPLICLDAYTLYVSLPFLVCE